jgi:cyclic pyranopterin monophosphate synthase
VSGSGLTHLDDRGQAHMVDVSAKDVTTRRAVASGRVRMLPSTLAAIRDGGAAKGDVLAVARVAGIAAAKETCRLIPLCHNIPLDRVAVDLDLVEEDGAAFVVIRAETTATGRTGVEMEALTAVSVAALAVYDMCKALERGMVVEAVRLESKEGGRRGSWTNA